MAALAAEFSLPLTDDSRINADQPSTPFGSTTSLIIDNYGPRQGLVNIEKLGTELEARFAQLADDF